MKKYFAKLHWFLSSQIGLDLRTFVRSFAGAPYFILGYIKFRRSYKGRITLKPCLHDRFESGGSTNSEYFWQDLLVAQLIFTAGPKRHVDIGSRIDGFIAHLATFRHVEVFDIRPIVTTIPNVSFKQANIMDPASLGSYGSKYCDSLSCLHAIEHFGLGRYGDPIDPNGYKIGLKNMLSLLEKDGEFYLSTPIGKQRVEFDSNYIFDPRNIINIVEENGLKILSLVVMYPDMEIKEVILNKESLNNLAEMEYTLGIFRFKRVLD